MWLRQSTASQEIILGPFLDSTDGDTPETGLTIANTDIKLWFEGGTTKVSKNSGGALHISGGDYYAVLDATDTATPGKLEVNVHVAGALAVRRSFMVLPAAVYDALVLGTDFLQVDVKQVNGVDAATFDGTAQAGAAGSITLASGASSVNSTYVDRTVTITGGTGVGQSRVISAYVGSTKVATVHRNWDTTPDNTSTYSIGSTAVAASVFGSIGSLGTQAKADVNAEVDTALADYDAPTNAEMTARTLATAFYATAANQTTIIGYIDTEVAAIKAKTDNLPLDPADASDIAALFATVNATLATITGYIDTEIGAIKAKTDNLPASPAAVSNIPTAAQIRAEIDASSAKLAQLAGAFEGSTSVLTEAALANAPTGGGGGGGITVEELREELDAGATVAGYAANQDPATILYASSPFSGWTLVRIIKTLLAYAAGKNVKNTGGTTTAFYDVDDPNGSPRITSTNTTTGRTPTVKS